MTKPRKEKVKMKEIVRRVAVTIALSLWLLGFVVPFTGLAPTWWFVLPAVVLSSVLWIVFMCQRFHVRCEDESK